MKFGRPLIASVLLLVACGCQRNDDSVTDESHDEDRPASLAGDSLDFGIRIKCVRLVMGDGTADAGFEVQNQGRSIVDVRGAETADGTRLTLAVEVFKGGKWERRPAGVAAESATFVELWPGAKVYGHVLVPCDAKWGRILVSARGLVRRVDGVTLRDPIEVTSDAFEITELK